MKKLLLISLTIAIFIGCQRNAITGRKQLNLVPESQLQEMAGSQYKQFLTESKVVSQNVSKDAAMVTRIGQRISKSVTEYYSAQGLGKQLEGYQWEYNLVDSKDVNAWCMPGGKIVVYTGLLPVSQNEAALAVVMGHEIAHALAHHSNERYSQGMLIQGIQIAGNVALSKNQQAVGLFNNLYGVGSNLGFVLPHGRKQELEADKFGLIYAAMAGYNPQEAIGLWQRMGQAAGGNKTPEFMSTHPSEENRIAKLQALMPEALKYYKPMNNGLK
jgi:predicted Zn-dependent protease